MHITYKLRNDRTGKIKEVTVYDGCSPTGGYSQGYVDRTGSEYAAYRAKEMLNTHSHHNDTWTYISGNTIQPSYSNCAV